MGLGETIVLKRQRNQWWLIAQRVDSRSALGGWIKEKAAALTVCCGKDFCTTFSSSKFD